MSEEKFRRNDRVKIVSKESKYYGETGRITDWTIDRHSMAVRLDNHEITSSIFFPTSWLEHIPPTPRPDRIGSTCWYQTWDSKAKALTPWRSGFLRAWSTEGDDDSHYPVAIVEDAETCMCDSILVQRICFSAEKPSK